MLGLRGCGFWTLEVPGHLFGLLDGSARRFPPGRSVADPGLKDSNAFTKRVRDGPLGKRVGRGLRCSRRCFSSCRSALAIGYDIVKAWMFSSWLLL